MLLYWTYIQRTIPYTTFNEVYLNGNYDLSFFLSYQEYQIPWIRSVKDGDNGKYLSDRFLFISDYDETILNQSQIDAFIASIPPEFQITILPTPNDTKEWLRANSSMVEKSDGVFIISEASSIMWMEYSERLLIIV